MQRSSCRKNRSKGQKYKTRQLCCPESNCKERKEILMEFKFLKTAETYVSSKAWHIWDDSRGVIRVFLISPSQDRAVLPVCTKQSGAGKLTQQLSSSSHFFGTVLCYLCARSSVELASWHISYLPHLISPSRIAVLFVCTKQPGAGKLTH